MSYDMDEDWDLYAVVRSFKTTTTTTTATASTSITNFNITTRENDDYLPNLESLSFGNNENNNFISHTLDNINQPFQTLQEIPREFLLNNPSTNPTSYILQHQLQSQEAQNLQPIVHREQFYPSTISFPVVNPQPIRPRRRKNQESKVVKQMTHDQLSTDSWAWRKYGQKPIKGSPYPRSYYRCSTSKGCCARKQVERSSTDPNIYFVSYTGDHTHPRPTHRSSLAGTTRTKFSTSTNTNLLLSTEAKKATCSSSSPVASGSSFSTCPTTPLVDGDNNDEENDVDDDDDDILIPNLVMDDDAFSVAWGYDMNE